MTKHPDVRNAVEARDKNHELDFDNLQMADLLKACTALEVVTEHRPDNDPNSRSSSGSATATSATRSCTGSTARSPTGPLGYGPSSQDPETGEIVSASAYIYGAALDIYAKFAADSVDLANGQLSIDDLLSGQIDQ